MIRSVLYIPSCAVLENSYLYIDSDRADELESKPLQVNLEVTYKA